MSKTCSLHYVSASHGGWGIVRMAALVPEAHLLFVCPSACGRHNAVGASVAGIKHRVSYLFLTEADIVSGDFEQMIVDNVDILFKALPKKPRALLIFTSCLDDLLGTDLSLIHISSFQQPSRSFQRRRKSHRKAGICSAEQIPAFR